MSYTLFDVCGNYCESPRVQTTNVVVVANQQASTATIEGSSGITRIPKYASKTLKEGLVSSGSQDQTEVNLAQPLE